MRDKMLNNTIWSFASKVSAMFFYFLADIVYARKLGVSEYAEWAFFFALATMTFYIGWFGLNTASKVFIAQSDEKVLCMGAALNLRLTVSIVISCIMAMVIPRFAVFIGYPVPYMHLKRLLFILPGMVFFNTFIDFFKQIYVGIQEYEKLFVIVTMEYALYFFCSVVFLQISCTSESIAWGYIVTGIIVFIVNILFVHKLYDFRLLTGKQKKEITKKRIFQYALPLILISMGGLVLTEMDTIMLGMLSTKDQVSMYSIAKQLCSKSTHVNMAIWMGTTTSLALITKENYKEKMRQFQKVNRINVVVSLIICICFLLFSGIAISVLYGSEYIEAAKLLRCLIPYQFLYCVSSFYANFLDFRGKAKGRAIWYISVIIINLSLNYLFIPRWGAVGASIATSVSLVPYTIYCLMDTRNEFKKLVYK